MELNELKTMWQQYDSKMSENIRINKEILKRMLRAKPERRVNWIRFRAWYSIIILPVIMILVYVGNFQFRNKNELEFYVGAVLVGISVAVMFIQLVKYLLLVRKIDLLNPVTIAKKNINLLEKYSTKIVKTGHIIFFLMMIGTVLAFNLPVKKTKFAVFVLFLTLFYFIAAYIKLKIQRERFKKLNTELDEIEELEKE